MSYIEKIEALSFPRGLQLLEYYRSKIPRDGGLPHRDQFEFSELLPLAPYMFIAEPISGGADWRYRLLGTRLVARFGQDYTNRPFSENFRELGLVQDAIELSNQVAKEGKPRFFAARFTDTETRQIRLETMSLPILAPDGETVWLLGGTFFEDEETAAQSDAPLKKRPAHP
ncbi:MAG: PAS domain-containing protein [Alphaproteobacteria bacterium]|nr:PAS domain-containing protein [Alphaproteobacteria bacterium]